jgi:hypothetical protein
VGVVRRRRVRHERLRVFARGSGVDATTQANGYSVGPTNTVLRFVKYVAGTSTTTDAAGGAVTANAWYWSRVRVNGSTIQQKMWPDGTTEPTTWAQTITDTQVTGPGGPVCSCPSWPRRA